MLDYMGGIPSENITELKIAKILSSGKNETECLA